MGASPRAVWAQRQIWLDGSRHVDLISSDGRDKPPVVFLHGWGLSPRSYLEPLDALAAWSRVHAFALPGFGSSSPLPKRADKSLSGYADVVASAWLEAGLAGSIPVVAHSMGSGVAVKLALNHPECVSQLVLVCPIGGAGSHPVTWLKLARSVAGEVHVKFFPRVLDSGPSMLRHPAGTLRAGFIAKTASLRRDVMTLLERDIPVTIVAAEDDGVVPPGPLLECGAKLVQVHGKHGWLLNRPEEFAVIVSDVLNMERPRRNLRRNTARTRRIAHERQAPAK